MATKFLSYLKLVWLCLKLSFNLLFLGLDILLLKVRQKKAWLAFGVGLVLLVWTANFYIWDKKNTPQLEITFVTMSKNSAEVALSKKKVLLAKDQIGETIQTYNQMAEIKIDNLGLWLNLKQLNEILENSELAQENLNKASAIMPQISNLKD